MSDTYSFDNNISDKEFAKRITKCLILFGEILPIYDKQSKAYFRGILGKDISEVLPQFFYDLAIQFSKKRTESTPYLIFLKESIDYTLGYTATMPDVNYPKDKLEKLMNKRIEGLNLDDTKPHIEEN